MAIDFITSLLQQANATGTRSTALTDLRWCLLIIVGAFLTALKLSPPTWVLVLIGTLMVLILLVYLSVYIYFATHSPDALRSERFTLSKLQIERSITGDNLRGFVDPLKDVSALEVKNITPTREISQ
jgi:hypothetical protein